jgi:hypothetical protein
MHLSPLSRFLGLAGAFCLLSINSWAAPSLIDKFTNASDWRQMPGWSKGTVAFGMDGLSITPTANASFQAYTLRYVGTGYRRMDSSTPHSLDWYGHPGPLTYSLTIGKVPALMDQPNKVGYTVILALVCNDDTPHNDPGRKPATVLMLKVEDVGPRPAVNGQNQFVSQLMFKAAEPDKPITQDHRLVRMANEQPDVMKDHSGTWSFTIYKGEAWMTNPLGERSQPITLPADLIAAHANNTASLYLTITNGQIQQSGTLVISEVSVSSASR